MPTWRVVSCNEEYCSKHELEVVQQDDDKEEAYSGLLDSLASEVLLLLQLLDCTSAVS